MTRTASRVQEIQAKKNAQHSHTPGPWHRSGLLIHTKDRIPIALAHCYPGIGPDLKNAALMQAAPELLAALSKLLDALNGDKDGDYFLCAEAGYVLTEARAAIARAKGEP